MYGILWNPTELMTDDNPIPMGTGGYTAVVQPFAFMMKEIEKKVVVSVFTGPFVEGKPILMLQIIERVFGTKRQAVAWARGCIDMQRVIAGNMNLRKEIGKIAKKINRNN